MKRSSSYSPLLMAALTSIAAQAQPGGCNAPPASPSVTISLPGNPFAVQPAADGCWVFVSVGGANGGIAVLKRHDGQIEMVRVVPVAPAPAGIVLTHDGKLLVAAANNAAVVLEVARMTAGTANPILGTFSGRDLKFLQSVYVNVTADDKLLFVSQESAQSITVIDLERARSNGFQPDAVLGNIAVGGGPIALTFSPDGKWLYTTSEGAAPQWNWPKACKPEGSGRTDLVNPEGAVIVVDVALARTDPSNAVAGRILAGCSPVRMAISPDGRRIYVTARNSNAVEAFDTAKLLSDPDHARVGMAPVGEAPVPVAVIDGGKKVVAGNSNRFAGGNAPQTLSVLDVAKIEQQGVDASLGTIPAGAFPRELSVSADGHTLFLTNAGSSSLQVMSVDHLLDAAGSAQAQRPAAPGPMPAPKAIAGDAAAADMTAAAEDTKNAGVASEYVTQLAAAGDAGATRLAASRAAGTADTAAAAAETAAAAVETDASKATAASAAGDRAAMNTARDQAMSDYSALLAADAELAKAATDLAAASAGNVAFYGGATTGAGAINDMGAQDSSAAANLLAVIAKGGMAGYSAAAANEATAIQDANTIASLAPPRAPAFQAAAKAEAEAQSAATAAAAGGSAAAAAAALTASATAGAIADGPGNPYAGAVETAAAAAANAVSATIAAQQAVDRLKALK
jgi:DNA-binding beta-propeller fold protein YncE